MAHNFRKLVNATYATKLYFSKAGAAAGATGTPDNPYRSGLQGLDGKMQVLGTGLYRYSWYDANPYGNGLVTADGIVIMEPEPAGNGAGTLTLARSGGGIFTFEGIRLQRYDRIVLRCFDNVTALAGIEFLKGELELNNQADNLKSEIYAVGKADVRVLAKFTDNISYNINQLATTYMKVIALRSIFRNCPALYIQSADFSYFDAATNLFIILGQNTAVKNCNIRGKVTYNGVTYNNVAEAQAAGILDSSNFSAEPGFNSEFARDYTLRIDSIHLVRNIGPNHLRLSNSIFLLGPEGEVTATSGHYFKQLSTDTAIPIIAAQNLVATLQGGQLRLQIKEAVGGSMVGKFRTGPIRVADVPQAITGIRFAAGLNFDTDYPALEGQFDPNMPQPLNNNVPNSHNYISGHAGRNPNRTEVPMRWSTKNNPSDNVATDWVTGEAFALFEWNEVALYNPVTNVGNGSPEFLTAEQTTVENAPRNPIAMWVQFEPTLMNNYYSR